ncbi:ficolin-2-like [Clytia hemisphaerica]|uniref:Fibrinogen C-terminal domain-containing protein n=2 Tax=Clytia hemisphaerica TaxID=252671 RepID=A0A7M5WR67_9CNID
MALAFKIYLFILFQIKICSCVLFNQFSINKLPSNEPLNVIEVEKVGQPRCISICHYDKKCLTMIISQPESGKTTCAMYNVSDQFMNFTTTPSDPSTKHILYTKQKHSCFDWLLAGEQKNGIYPIAGQRQVQCNFEYKSCNDVLSAGNEESGFYYLYKSPDQPPVYEECIFYKRDCKDWKDAGYTQTGVYTIRIEGFRLVDVKCEMDFEDGGWIIMQQRFDGSVDFHLFWDDFKEGFGDLNGEFWLGNEIVHQLTKNGDYEWYFKATAFDGDVGESRYFPFVVDNEATNYLSTATKLSGISSLTNNVQFTTRERDNDPRGAFNCAFKYGNDKGGGFWYGACGAFYPNGEYHNSVGGTYQKYVYWNNYRGYSESLKETIMMIRKRSCS